MRLDNPRKSSFSEKENCVEVGRGQLGDDVVAGIQDTKQSALGDARDQVIVSPSQYASFIDAVRSGRFDR